MLHPLMSILADRQEETQDQTKESDIKSSGLGEIL